MPQKHSSSAARAGIVVNFAVCMSNSSSEILPNIHLVFYPTESSPKKRKLQATTDPDGKTTSSLDSESSSTVDTSSSEGEYEKDFILPDYPSEELTSSKSSDSVGPQNIPDDINNQSTALSFLKLFLNIDFWRPLCRQTNFRAEQVKQSKSDSYSAKSFKPLAVPKLKAFLGLRLQMEKCVINPWYESYWQEASHNFIAHTPGFREVMEHNCFIDL